MPTSEWNETPSASRRARARLSDSSRPPPTPSSGCSLCFRPCTLLLAASTLSSLPLSRPSATVPPLPLSSPAPLPCCRRLQCRPRLVFWSTKREVDTHYSWNDRRPCRFYHGRCFLNTAVRFISLFLFATGAYSANSIIIGWVAATCGQTPEKKAGALSIMNCIAMASFIYTPYLYPASDSPRYLMAMSANAAFVTGVIICTWTMRFWLQQVNKKLRSGDATARLLYAY